MSGGEKIDKERVLFAHQVQAYSRWMDKVVSKLTGKVYVTIDLDVFDSSIMPSTGTPEPGGLGWYQVVGMLKQLCAEKEVVGFDVVELCPNKANKAPNFLAAKLIYTFLSYRFSEER
jgi:agmatinase